MKRSKSVTYMQMKQQKIGFVINPISGMGGSVGLKGTDGRDILKHAIKLGAKPQINERAKIFLNVIKQADLNVILLTPPGPMGGNVCVETQINHSNIPSSEFRNVLTLYNTTKRDTQDALKYMMKHNVAIIVFFGGDGTARDVAEIVQLHTPCLGIPGGVKVFSSVFAASPSKGAELIVQFLHGSAPIVESEVLDIDEEAFRRNQIEVKLFGYLKTPHAPLLLQGMKQATPFSDDEYENQVAIARTIIEDMDSTSYYIFGPGTTVRAIFDLMKLEKTLLGFDIVKNGQLIASDVNESEIMQIVKKGTIKLVISPIGRQGFVFGRGNLQITGKIISEISKDNIHVICSRSKLSTLPEGYIRTDIRDPEMDKKLRGFYRVLIDYHEYKMIKMI